MCRLLYRHKFSTHLGECLGVWLLDLMVRLCLALYETARIFQSGCTVLHSHQQRGGVPGAPHPLQHLMSSVLLIFSHSSRCIVVSHWCLYLWFSHYIFVEHFFHSLFATCLSSLVRCLFRSFVQFWIILFYCWVLGILYMLYIQVLYQMCVLQRFSSSQWFIFTVSFTEQKFSILISTTYHYFLSWSVLWCCIYKLITRPQVI